MARKRRKFRHRDYPLPPMGRSAGASDTPNSEGVEGSALLEEALNETFPASDPISELSSLVAGRPSSRARAK
jgi:hypothetical protein